MKNHAFTLIELLVVVLIIGILAAIALPQYQKAVLKSRAVAAMVYVKSLRDAEERYYLANNDYTANEDNLDVSATCPPNWTCRVYYNKNVVGDVYAENETGTFAIVYYFDHALPADSENAFYNGAFYCWASVSDERAKQLCQSMGPELLSDESKVRHRLN